MNLATWSITKPAPTILLFVVLGILGWTSFYKLPVQSMPDLDLPTVIVSATLPGAPADIIETEITRKVEDAVANLSGVSQVTSTVNEGVSSTAVEFDLGKNSQLATEEVRDAVSRVRGKFPAAAPEPSISKVNSTGNAVITYGIQSSHLDAESLSWFVDNTVSNELRGVTGVSNVVRLGGVSREIRVELDPAAMAGVGTTAAEISNLIKAYQQEAPAGRSTLGGSQQTLRASATARTAADLANYTLRLTNGRSVRLGDIARILDGVAERTQSARLNGKPVISFQVYRSTGYGEVAVAAAARTGVAALQAKYPEVTITEVSNTTGKVLSQYDSSMSALYEGAVLAIIVVGLFLRDARATLISAVALPLSILPTFFAMHALGYSLNGVTLLAITLVVGMLVDDAIVEVENIVRHLRMGKSPRQAAADAVMEIGVAVIATTLTLVAVFLPTAFMDGVPGLIFKQFGITAAIAVLMSLLVARLLTPLMAAHLLKPIDHDARVRWVEVYIQVLDQVLSRPKITLGGAALLFVVALALGGSVPTSFIPATDSGKVRIGLELAPGADLEQTEAVAARAEQLLLKLPDTQSVYTTIGSGSDASIRGSGSAGEVRKATVVVDLKPHGRTQRQVEAAVRPLLAQIPGIRVTVGGGGSGERYSLVLAGDDPAVLDRTVRELTHEIRNLPKIGNVTVAASLSAPQVEVVPDLATAGRLGVSAQSISQTLRVATSGDYDSSTPKLNLGERQIPIKVQLPDAYRGNLDNLRMIQVPAGAGSVPLAAVAELRMASAPNQITRMDRQRNLTVQIELAGRPLGEVVAAVAARPAMQALPPGVHVVDAGETKRMRELFGGFAGAMLLGLACIFGLLVLLFEDFLQPVTILSALPLAVAGALVALVVSGSAFSLPSLIGVLALMGIVTKNSILLVEYAMTAMQHQGLSRRDAIRQACEKRARPIVMTTVAMSAGMLPLLLGLEGDTSFRAPMATVVLGGLLASTLLSLFVVPVVFEYLSRGQAWMNHKVRGGSPE